MSHRNNASRGETESSITDYGTVIDQPSMDANHAAAEQAMASYGVLRDDGIWVTECAWCKRVRSVAGDWQSPTRAIRAATGLTRTHGICPQCAGATAARADDESVDRRPR